jgi:hypothetical protein
MTPIEQALFRNDVVHFIADFNLAGEIITMMPTAPETGSAAGAGNGRPIRSE